MTTTSRWPSGWVRQYSEEAVGFPGRDGSGELTHAELEGQLATRARALLGQLFQGHMDLRSLREIRRDDVADADQVPRGPVESDHHERCPRCSGK